MGKFLKIILILVSIIVIIIVATLLFIGKVAKERNEKYYEYSNATGVIEKRYTNMGSSEVLTTEITSDSAQIGKWVIYYPKELEAENKKIPVVLWANGTGSKSGTYKSFLTHLSSWGFISISNDDENSRTGESLNATIDLLLKENENPNSVFYQKIDVENIGIGGHSQGGPAVFNMVTVQPHADLIKTVYAVSATSKIT